MADLLLCMRDQVELIFKVSIAPFCAEQKVLYCDFLRWYSSKSPLLRWASSASSHEDSNHEGTRTLNLLIRSQTPCPLGHVVSFGLVFSFCSDASVVVTDFNINSCEPGVHFGSRVNDDVSSLWVKLLIASELTHQQRCVHSVDQLNLNYWPVWGSNPWPWRY